MNITVCVKQVPDTETKIKIAANGQGIDTTGIKWIMSPYDEFAVEEALRQKEKNAGSTVTVVAAGPVRVVETLRTALAMGCDNAVHVEIPETADSTLTAKSLAAALKKETPANIIYSGKEAIDDGAAQVSQLLSEFMELPAVTVALEAKIEGAKALCKREVEGGAFEMVEVTLPAVIAAQKGMNEPRYASLPNIMKAKKKEVKTYKLADLGLSENDQKIKFKNFEMPPPKQAGKKLDGEAEQQAKELVRLLHEEAKVI